MSLITYSQQYRNKANFFFTLFDEQKALKSATVVLDEDTGTSTGSPAKGTTRTPNVTDVNWKNSGTQATLYSAAPITAGNASYPKWQFLHFTGSFNQILNGLVAHTSGAVGTGVTLYGPAHCTGDGDRPLYTTPSNAVDNTACPYDMSSVVAIGSGRTLAFGPTGPEATGKGASSTSATTYSNYVPTQLRTTVSAAPGDLASSLTLTYQWNEN